MRKKLLWGILVVAVIIVSIFGIRVVIHLGRRCNAFGTASAIDAALSSELDAGNPVLTGIFLSGDKEWRLLSDREYDEVLVELAKKKYSLDTPPNWMPSEPLLDPWGQRFIIKYRDRQGAILLQVSSAGADRQPETSDDVTTQDKK